MIENFEQEKALNANKAKAERAEQMKLEFLRLETTFTNLVHETKTPITLIDNYISDHIQKHGSSKELEVVSANVRKLSKDIGNLFDLERFKKGIDFFDHDQELMLSGLVKGSVDFFASYCKSKGIRLTSDIEEGLYVKADPLSINRILNNLVENAIKYAKENTQISITLSSEESRVVLSVSDQGPGIAPDDLAGIFTPYNLLNKRKKNFQGMGLGLPMVKSIVDTLKGTISIQNISSGGTKVSVVLPSEPAASNAEEVNFAGDITLDHTTAEIPEGSIIDPTAPELLIVEDNDSMRHYLAGKLGILYNIRMAINGKDAIRQLEMRMPDLVLSDVMMDDLDGFEMIKTMRQMPAFRHLPVIFLTARSEEKDKIGGLGLGAIGYIEKPFTMDVVLKKIESILTYTETHRVKLYSDAYALMGTLSGKGQPEATMPLAVSFDEKCEKYSLTKREKEITRLLLEGKSGRAIAETIFISAKTVETHISNIYEKMNISSRVELIKLLH